MQYWAAPILFCLIASEGCEYGLLGVNGNSCGVPDIRGKTGNVALWPIASLQRHTDFRGFEPVKSC